MTERIPIRWCYSRDDQHVYYGKRILEGADPHSLEILETLWARNRSHVYLSGHILPNADPSSFVMLNHIFAKDANHVWTISGIVKNADAHSFNVLDAGLDDAGYGRDQNNVYFLEQYFGKANIVKNAKPTSFHSFGNGFGKDDKKVFFGRFQLSKAMPESWRPLQRQFSQDDRRVYYQNKQIPDADPETFQVLPGDPQWARDKNRCYEMLDIRDREEYFQDFRGFYIFVGVVRNAFVIDKDFRQVLGETWADLNAQQRVRFEIECMEWLYHPLEEAPNQPKVGGLISVTTCQDRMMVKDLIGRNWIWFFKKGPKYHADRDMLQPLLDSEIFEPLENRPKVEALIREAR